MEKLKKNISFILIGCILMSFIPSNFSLAMEDDGQEKAYIEESSIDKQEYGEYEGNETSESAIETSESAIETSESAIETSEIPLEAKAVQILAVDTINQTQEATDTRKYLNLPASYKLTDYGLVTSVKDQGLYGTCWAFAAVGSAESNLLVDGSGTYDLSEYQLAYFTYNNKVDPLGGTQGDSTSTGEYNFLEQGGNSQMANVTWAMGAGIADESIMNYNTANASAYFSTDYAYKYNKVSLKNCYWIPIDNKDNIKQLIKTSGAGVISLFWNDGCYNTSNQSYYNNACSYSNHDVIVFVSSNRWQLFFVFQNDIFYLILGSPNKPLLAFFYQ